MNSLIFEIKEIYDELSPVNKKIASFLIKSAKEVAWMSGKQLSEETGVSQASITRFCQLFKYTGFGELKIALLQEVATSEQITFQATESEEFKDDIQFNLMHQNILALQETCNLISQSQLNLAARIIHESKKILCVGMGASDLVAQDMTQKLLRIQKNVYNYHDLDLRKVLLSQFQENDLLFVVSYSGEKKEILELASIAKSQNIKIIALTKNSETSLSALSDLSFKVASFENAYRTSAVSSRISHLYLVDVIFYTYSLFFQEETFEKLKKTFDIVNIRKD